MVPGVSGKMAPRRSGKMMKRNEVGNGWSMRTIILTPRGAHSSRASLQWIVELRGGFRQPGIIKLDESSSISIEDDALVVGTASRVLFLRSAGPGEGTVPEWYEAVRSLLFDDGA